MGQIDASGAWVPSLFPKQWEAMQACSPSLNNLILLSGPRKSSKTVVCCHAVCQHAWNTDRGNILIVTLTQSVGTDSGVWTDLVESILPEWIDGNFGMEWVKRPYLDAGTKKPACIVTNKFGNHTKIQLDSLKNHDEVEDRYKGKRYSMIFMNELSKFTTRKVFDTLKQALRMMHLKKEDHLFLADSNPCLLFGAGSWIYKLWYEFKMMTDDELLKNFPDAKPGSLKPLQNALKLIEFTVDDNLSMSEEDKADLLSDFAHDPDLVAAYFYGKWTTASVDAIFYKVFRENFHVVGEISSPANPNPEILVPTEGCFELLTGWDPGTTHCAFSMMEKVFSEDDEKRERPIFLNFDELVVHGDVLMYDFVEEVLEKMDYWEGFLERKILWKHYSDRNIFSVKDLSGQLYMNQLIYQISEGRIALIGAWEAQSGRGSVERGIQLFRKILFEERWRTSREKCQHAISMCKSLRRKKGEGTGISAGSIHKHVFDSNRYVVTSECYQEMMASTSNITRKIHSDSHPAGLVQVPMR